MVTSSCVGAALSKESHGGSLWCSFCCWFQWVVAVCSVLLVSGVRCCFVAVGGWLFLLCFVFLVCCSLSAVCCLLCSVCCLLFDVCCLLCGVCCVLFVVRWLLFVVCCLLLCGE